MFKHTLIAAAVALAVTATAAFAAHEQHGAAPHAKAAAPQCPVMKHTVASPEKAAKSVYKGKTYYYCCPGCKPKFDKDPTRYICPVTGEILPAHPTTKSVYKGKTYYFCCAGCKPKFDKSPAKYLPSR